MTDVHHYMLGADHARTTLNGCTVRSEVLTDGQFDGGRGTEFPNEGWARLAFLMIAMPDLAPPPEAPHKPWTLPEGWLARAEELYQSRK